MNIAEEVGGEFVVAGGEEPQQLGERMRLSWNASKVAVHLKK